MPLSGAASPSRSESNVDWASPPTLSVPMTLPTEPTVMIRPQNVRNVARFVQPGGDRIQNPAHHGRGDRHPAHAVAQNRRHRGEQDGRPLHGQARIRQPEAVDPFDLRKQPDDLPEGQHDADDQHEDDHRIEQDIGRERDGDLLVEDDHHERAQDQEHHHPDQKNPGRGQLQRIEVTRHGGIGQRSLKMAHTMTKAIHDIGNAKGKSMAAAKIICCLGVPPPPDGRPSRAAASLAARMWRATWPKSDRSTELRVYRPFGLRASPPRGAGE
jgi:hypothetical protein